MSMGVKTFKFKIFAIFLIPAISIVYFTFFYVNFSDSNFEALENQKHNIELVKKLIDVVHALQAERSISVKILSSNSLKNLQDEIQSNYKRTDRTIENLKAFQYDVGFQSLQLQTLRQKILNKKISFEEALKTYSKVNEHIINNIKFLLPKLDKQYDSLFLMNLELLKESASLENGCVYYTLIAQNLTASCKEKIFYYQTEQLKKQENLVLYSNKSSLASYSKYIDINNENKLAKLRELYKNNALTKDDATEWYEISANNINAYEKVSKDILTHFIIELDNKYKTRSQDLNIAIILWGFSILAAIYFIFLINKLFKQYEKYTQELELSSLTLDSYEGVVITDKDTNIIKVNKGFERITGYSADEAYMKKTSLLKSGKNPRSLYKGMWGSINTTGSWTGEVINKRKDGKLYSQRLSISAVRDNNGEVQNYIGHLFDITELRKAQQEAFYQASHDSLTELMNRKYLLKRMNEEISRAKRHNFKNAFLFIDLDHFKEINDNYGHHVGDKLLKHVAATIKNSIRDCDLVARISGDEFAVVLLNLDRNEEEIIKVVSLIVNKILMQLNKEVLIEGHKLTIGSSIGVRLFPLNKFDNEDQIIKDADSAMYDAKNNGKNHFVIYKE